MRRARPGMANPRGRCGSRCSALPDRRSPRPSLEHVFLQEDRVDPGELRVGGRRGGETGRSASALQRLRPPVPCRAGPPRAFSRAPVQAAGARAGGPRALARLRASSMMSASVVGRPVGATSMVEPSKSRVPSGRREGDGAVGVQGEVPAAVVDEVMVPVAERQQVGEVGGTVMVPVDDVMDLTVGEAHGAVGVATGAVHRPQRAALRPVATRWSRPRSKVAPVASSTTGGSSASQARRRTVSGGSGWPSLVSHTDAVVQAVAEGVVVDEHGDLGRPPVGAAGAGDQGDEGVGVQLVEAPLLASRAWLVRRRSRRPARRRLGRRLRGPGAGGCGTSRCPGRSTGAATVAGGAVHGGRRPSSPARIRPRSRT